MPPQPSSRRQAAIAATAKAADQWRKGHDILAALVQAGLHVSPQDLEFLERLREKLGG